MAKMASSTPLPVLLKICFPSAEYLIATLGFANIKRVISVVISLSSFCGFFRNFCLAGVLKNRFSTQK